jgi:hypothetical protein
VEDVAPTDQETVLLVAFSFADPFNILAGLPTTIVSGGTSLVTTLPAPTMAFSPIVPNNLVVR